MIKYLKKVLCIMVSLVMIFILVPFRTYAQEDNLKLSRGEYLIINSKLNKLAYYKDGKFIKEFRVATGKSSTPTPTGKFKIANKIKNRPYYSGGIPGGSPRNPLGDRWIGLAVGATFGTTYAVHGNNNESSIGGHVSGGCIRMHNSEIRWLYDQIGTSGYTIIDYSDKSFTQIASKYGVTLNDPNEVSQNIKNVQAEYKKFINYNNQIDLTNSNSLIINSADASNILASKESYLNAYNNLKSSEKNNTQIQKIHGEFNKIISIVKFAEASLRFCENVSANAEYIKDDINWVRRLNTLDGDEFGTRGKALRQYNEAIEFGENKGNSSRISYLDKLYTDSCLFLYVLEYLDANDEYRAKESATKIQNENLKSIANRAIDNLSDIDGHWAEADIKQAMNYGWVDNVKKFRPYDIITRAEFVKIINRAFNFTESGNIEFSDVYENDWYYNDICIAVKAGYIEGIGDNTFKPKDYITRQEVAKIMTEIMQNEDDDLDKIRTYTDFNEVSEWALPFVEGAIENGYMGKGGGEFRPKANITRSESVVTIKRAIK